MVIATTDRPVRAAEMGHREAEEVTQLIKENFDSLGAMLMQARDRKAYKALGYRSFESYCQSEFGKSISSAYQLIEDAKVLSQLEAKISESYGEEVTLKFPASHLRPLKAVEDIDDKLKAIEYAQKLAAAENRKATKKDLEIAVFQVSGKRSEDFREAIQSLGFQRGVQIEVSKSLNKDRGIVTKVDKGGQIYVELHYGGLVPIPYDAADLRILTKAEQPANPASDNTLNKGDKVKIFAKGLEGKTGEVYIWKPGKLVSVVVEDTTLPVDIAYAEIEIIPTNKKDSNWETELVWDSGKNTYYYFPQENKITSNLWPTGLALEPYTDSGNPVNFMEHWETRFAGKILESLGNPARVKTLALAQAIELPEAEGKAFAAELISSLLQLFPDASPEPIIQKALGISFSQTVDELVSGKKTQTRRAWQDDYAKSFIRYFDENIAIPALDKGRHRGGHELGFIKLTQRPYQQYLSEMTAIDLQAEGGMVATTQEFINTFFERQDKLVWVLHFEFLPSRSSDAEALLHENERLREQLLEAETTIEAMIGACAATAPRDTAAHSDFLAENTSETSSPGDTAAHTDFPAESIADIPDSEATEADWKSILASNNFTPNYHYTDDCTEEYRGWKIYLDPNGGFNYVDLNHPEKGAFCCDVNWLNIKFKSENEDKIVNWAKGIVNQIEEFCPGQLSLFSTAANPISKAPKIEIEEELPPNISRQIPGIRNKFFSLIEKYEQAKKFASKRKEIENIDGNIKTVQERLKALEKFEHLRIGQTVCHQRQPMILGKIIGLDFSQGEMPIVWIKYFRNGELEKTPTSELVGMIFTVNI